MLGSQRGECRWVVLMPGDDGGTPMMVAHRSARITEVSRCNSITITVSVCLNPSLCESSENSQRSEHFPDMSVYTHACQWRGVSLAHGSLRVVMLFICLLFWCITISNI